MSRSHRGAHVGIIRSGKGNAAANKRIKAFSWHFDEEESKRGFQAAYVPEFCILANQPVVGIANGSYESHAAAVGREFLLLNLARPYSAIVDGRADGDAGRRRCDHDSEIAFAFLERDRS